MIKGKMEIEKGKRGGMEMVEKEVEEVDNNKKLRRRGGIRTLPFILGETSH